MIDVISESEANVPFKTKYIGGGKKNLGIDELWKAVRKFSSENILNVATILDKTPGLTFAELTKATGLKNPNDLNHALYDMKNQDLVIVIGEKKGERKYYLTKYGWVLLCALDNLLRTQLTGDDVFSAYPAATSNSTKE